MARNRRPLPGRKVATVSPRRSFVKDVEAQIAWLASVDREDWIEPLERALSEAVQLLAATPQAGTPDPAGDFRRLLLRRLPFVIWYRIEGVGRVSLYRLFHVRQSRRGGGTST